MAAVDAGAMDVDGVRIHARTHPSFNVHLGFGQLVAHWHLLHHAENSVRSEGCARHSRRGIDLVSVCLCVCVAAWACVVITPPPTVVMCDTFS